jgi:hypothetical protein
MKCVNHPDIDAADACTKCGCGVCAECKRELAGKTYCQVCIDVYSQLQPEALLAACVNVLNIDGVSVCYKCGKRISDNHKQELYDKTFCPLCAQEIITEKANVALFFAETTRKETSENHPPKKEGFNPSPFKFILPFGFNPSLFKFILPFLPINPLYIICGAVLHRCVRLPQRFRSGISERRTDFYEDKYNYLKHLNNVAGVCLIAGILFTFILPLCLIMMVGSPGGQNTLDNMVKAGISLATIGIILTMISLYLHIAVRISVRKAIILGIVLVIFGIVWFVKL